LQVELAMEKGNCTVWMTQEAGCAVPCVCSEAKLTTSVPLEAVLWSIYSAEERLLWDASSFVNYEVLCSAANEPNGAQWDALYCRMPAPRGMTDRDVVQERFLFRLQEPGGGFAIVMRSPSDARSLALLGPAATTALQRADSPATKSRVAEEGFLGDETPSSRASPVHQRDTSPSATRAVRATTVLSAYLVRPLPEGGGVRVTAMSQTDLGGNIPGWAQVMAKKAGTHKFIDWAKKLQAHCDSKGAHAILDARAQQALGRLTAATSAPEGAAQSLPACQPSPPTEALQVDSKTTSGVDGKLATRSVAPHWFIFVALLFMALNTLIVRLVP